MTRASSRVLMLASLLVPMLARAEGKCGDDPVVWKNMLIVTWTIPHPANAAVDPNADRALMDALDDKFGALPPGFPPAYGGLAVLEYPETGHGKDKQKLPTLPDLQKYHEDFKMPLGKEAVELFRTKYYDPGKQVYARVVQHPPVPNNGQGYSFCTCTLQRAVVVWDKGEEQLWLKSRFRNADSSGNFVNFAPKQPIKFTFKSDKIWFPLALNEIVPQKDVAAFLLLDVLTRSELKIPGGQLLTSAFNYGGDNNNWYVTRISGAYARGNPVKDLEFDGPPPKAP